MEKKVAITIALVLLVGALFVQAGLMDATISNQVSQSVKQSIEDSIKMFDMLSNARVETVKYINFVNSWYLDKNGILKISDNNVNTQGIILFANYTEDTRSARSNVKNVYIIKYTNPIKNETQVIDNRTDIAV